MSLRRKLSIVCCFELATEDLEEVQEQMDGDDVLEDAWGLLCPEQEVERLESKEENREKMQGVNSEHEQEPIPDLAVSNQQIGHVEKANVMSLRPNCIAVVETWLTVDSSFQTSHIEGYNFHSRPRSLSYQSSGHLALTRLLGQQHGGVGMYCEENLNYEVAVQDFCLECLANYFAEHKIIVAVVYRPPSYPMSLFKYNLDRLLNWLESYCATVAVLGDFNDDILKSSSLCNFMMERGYVQYVKSPTTERGTLIDHLYLKSTEYDLDSVVVPTYFSDHEGIVCSFKSLNV
ncbi:uncharacterized protein [Eucyclogobius newberryi]|uniref:uncharacterized protein n=1 Tax=Eucyclogobius newberryi TaxID=166745 RepID=UPI003B59B526